MAAVMFESGMNGRGLESDGSFQLGAPAHGRKRAMSKMLKSFMTSDMLPTPWTQRGSELNYTNADLKSFQDVVNTLSDDAAGLFTVPGDPRGRRFSVRLSNLRLSNLSTLGDFAQSPTSRASSLRNSSLRSSSLRNSSLRNSSLHLQPPAPKKARTSPPVPQRKSPPPARKATSKPFQGPLDTGAWLPHEDKVLHHIIYAFASFELKIIAEVAWKCGIHRPRRAIDKKVKRILRFDKWRERNIKKIKQEIRNISEARDMQFLSASEDMTFERVRAEYDALNMPSERMLF
mmetsp:Transcript_18431/g.29996  ORF Transcript_18431/g.29996 Transcript_18431/m.29996 type:complete len:289 (-) Transcript_18431:1185-2051(-)